MLSFINLHTDLFPERKISIAEFRRTNQRLTLRIESPRYESTEGVKGRRRKVLSTPLIRLDESRTVGLRDPLCIRRIGLRFGKIKVRAITRSRRLSHENPEHNFSHTRISLKSPEIMLCCSSLLGSGLQKHYLQRHAVAISRLKLYW